MELDSSTPPPTSTPDPTPKPTPGDEVVSRPPVTDSSASDGVAPLLTVGIAWAVAGRILVHGNDDTAALAETFNGMLDRPER